MEVAASFGRAGSVSSQASRIQSVAPPGSVLVGEATFRATRDAIAFEEAGEHVLKGKRLPVPVWRALRVVGKIRGAGRSERLEPPFIGRDEELRLLKEAYHTTVREGKARLVSVIGQAGLGKSRLAWEFSKYTDGLGDAVSVVIPKEASAAAPYAISLVRNGPNPNAGRLWLNFVMTDLGQGIFAQGFVRPAVPGTKLPDSVADKLPDAPQVRPLDVRAAAERKAEIDTGWLKATSAR